MLCNLEWYQVNIAHGKVYDNGVAERPFNALDRWDEVLDT
jgi:hypothetical protein